MNIAGKVPRYLESRDPEDFRQLVEQYQHKVFRLVASVLGPYREAEAEDVAQEVFLQVHRKVMDFRGQSQFTTWLYAVARNRALDRRKQARFRLPHLPEQVLGSFAAVSPDADGSRRMMIAECLERLPELYRTLIYLHYWQESSIDEIAGYTGLVPGTVKSYLARARQRVEAQLAERGVHSYE
jgi:RNA polymerase sigma-70 factor (ECF subfamily)